MPKFVKMSADEAQSKRRDHLASVGGKDVGIVKAAKAPASWNKDQRSARFVMSTQSVDRYGDIVVTDGIDTTEFERNPVGLLFHASRSWPIGSWGDLTKELNRRPPRLEGTLEMLPEGGPVKEIDEAAWMIANGGVRACSIGFMPDWDNVEGIVDDEGFWTGLKFNVSYLLECSVCGVPANAGALIKQADGDPRLARELLEDVLDNWTRSPEGLLMPRDEFEKAYRVSVEKIAADEIVPPGAGPTAEEVDAFVAKAIEADAVLEENDAGFKAHAGGQIIAELKTGMAGVDLHIDIMKRVAEGKAAKAAPVLELTDDLIAEFAATLTTPDTTVHLHLDDHPCIKAGTAKLPLPVTLSFNDAVDVYQRVKAAVAKQHENKTETNDPGREPVVVTMKADTSEVEAAVTKVEGLFARLAKQFPMFFPKAIEERIEPTIEPPAPAEPPSAEAISAALSKAAGTRERLAAKGLIAA